MHRIIKLFTLFIIVASALTAHAHIDPNRSTKGTKTTNENINFREDCVPSSAQTDQSINNVRARLLTGGDVWWDGQGEGRYIVPKQEPGSGVPEVSSIFAASIWLGGYDPSGNLKVAAGDYRSGGVDFFPGPLDPETGLTDLEQCNEWDRFFEVTGADILQVIGIYNNCINNPDCNLNIDSIPDGVRYWPALGNEEFADFYGFELPFNDQGLGSFWDEDQDGLYDPVMGDFPIIDIRGCEPDTRKKAETLVPDEMIFWIFNDAGAPHALSNGAAINMEVQVQSFGYATNDELNDMTFQRYKLVNRASVDIRDAYFALWVDPDLGCHTDDYIGCDVDRSLMYVYNEDLTDGSTGCNCDSGVPTYCDRVPILGVDYFRGPLGPKQFNIDANGDTTLTNPPIGGSFDTLVELGMSSFLYLNNCGVGGPDPLTCDPNEAEGYYNVLQGLWPQGGAVTFGGSGLNLGSTDSVKFVFPDAPNSDGWSMCTADLAFGDRRTIQASGPFLLTPGAVNELIIGVPWVPDITYPCPDISRLLAADDLAQAVFDNCFEIPRGPDAPDLCVIELDREIVLVLSNDPARNNFNETYREEDILAEEGAEDIDYVFEGYKIYQLAHSNVSAQELDDVTRAKLVRQVDVKNGITELYNWESTVNPTSDAGDLVFNYEIKVNGGDKGVAHTFQINEDAFAEGDRSLINHKEYYFTVIAYAYNEYEPFDVSTGLGQKTPYREGRLNIKNYTAIPRPIVYENMNSFYGDGPTIFRLEGVGSGGNSMELTDEMYERILNGENIEKLQYVDGRGPINVKIYNPLDVVDGTYELEILGEFVGGGLCEFQDSATWQLTHKETGEVFQSTATIDEINEQIFGQFGFSIEINQADEPGTNVTPENGLVSAELSYNNVNDVIWFAAVEDDGAGFETEDQPLGPFAAVFDFLKTNEGQANFGDDMTQAFSTFGDGYWYPFWLCDYRQSQDPLFDFYITPAWKNSSFHQQILSDNGLYNLNNVDIVFTSDKSKWSRCVVVETATEDYLEPVIGVIETTIGDANMMELRQSPSVDKDGNPMNDGTVGMSWFPGYAIDVETGKRVNIFFGENSIFDEDKIDLLADNIPLGGDMLFNPSSQFATPLFDPADPLIRELVMGGGHNVYCTRQDYDGCAEIAEALASNLIGMRNVLRSVTWCSMVMLPGNVTLDSYEEGVIPNDLTVKLRVNNEYSLEREFILDEAVSCNTIGGNPRYEFVIDGKSPSVLEQEEYEGALEEVRAVPNPYYGISAYEANQFQNLVRITNLPDECTVSIYSLDGKFIREYNRSETETAKGIASAGVQTTQTVPSLDWDLKNYAGIPVASGVYLIHIEAPELGESRTIKWFGLNREFDPSGL